MMDLYNRVADVGTGVVIGGLLTWFGKRVYARLLTTVRTWFLNKYYVSLEEEFSMAKALADEIASDQDWKRPDLIFAVSPGGGMVAEWLSRRFLGDFWDPIPVRTIFVKTTRATAGSSHSATSYVVEEHSPLPEQCSADTRVLLVDDMTRGGQTLQVAYDHLLATYAPENVAIASLVRHATSHITPKFCAIETSKDVRFAWKDGL